MFEYAFKKSCVIGTTTSQMHNELGARVTTACLQLHGQNRDEEYVLPPGAEIGTPIFELYFALQDFVK